MTLLDRNQARRPGLYPEVGADGVVLVDGERPLASWKASSLTVYRRRLRPDKESAMTRLLSVSRARPSVTLTDRRLLFEVRDVEREAGLAGRAMLRLEKERMPVVAGHLPLLALRIMYVEDRTVFQARVVHSQPPLVELVEFEATLGAAAADAVTATLEAWKERWSREPVGGSYRHALAATAPEAKVTKRLLKAKETTTVDVPFAFQMGNEPTFWHRRDLPEPDWPLPTRLF